jgi:hypothetical protein
MLATLLEILEFVALAIFLAWVIVMASMIILLSLTRCKTCGAWHINDPCPYRNPKHGEEHVYEPDHVDHT